MSEGTLHLALGLSNGVSSVDLGSLWLVALFLFSCVLVGLAQQTIP